jgi:hypothetical protein
MLLINHLEISCSKSAACPNSYKKLLDGITDCDSRKLIFHPKVET